jgi:tetratricopeptide (TPR) repeat protein
MARDTADRQLSAGALADELEHGLRAPVRRTGARLREAPTAATTVHRSPKTRRRRNWLPVAATGLLVVLAAALGVAALGGGDGGDPAPSATGGDRDARKPVERSAPDTTATEDAAPAPQGAVASDEATPTSGSPATLNDQGDQLMQAGRYDEAIPLLEEAVAAYPDGSSDLTYAYALYNLGRSLRLVGRPDEAVPILERRLRIPNQTATVQRELDAARAAAG